MIFKTFNNDIDKISAKWGIFGKSFYDIGTAIRSKISDINKNFQATDDIVGSIQNSGDSIWKRLYPNKEDIKPQLIDVMPEINVNNIVDVTEKIKTLSEDVASGAITWQKLFDTLPEGQKHLAHLGQQLEGQIITTENVSTANQNARASAIAHNKALEQQTLGAKASKLALSALATVGNMFLSWAFTKGIELAVTAIHNYINRVEIAEEKTKELLNEYENISSEITTLEGKLEELNKQIDGLDPITDAQDIENLKLETAELNAQLAILREKQALTEQEKNEAANKSLTMTQGSKYALEDVTYTDWSTGVTYNTKGSKEVTSYQELELAMKAYDGYKQKVLELNEEMEGIGDKNSDAYLDKAKELEDLSKKMQDARTHANDLATSIQSQMGALPEDSDLKDIIIGIINGYAEWANEINGATDALKENGEAITENGNKTADLLGISETVDSLNTKLKPAMDALGEAYQGIFTSDGFTRENIGLDMFSSIKDELDELSDAGINIDYSSFEELYNVLNDTESSADDIKDAFDKLAYSIASASLSGIEDFETLKNALKELGYVEFELTAFESLVQNKEALMQAGLDLETATEEQIAAFANEIVSVENVAHAIDILTYAKQLNKLQDMDTSGEVANLKTLAENAEYTGNVIKYLTELEQIYQEVAKGTLSPNVLNARLARADELKTLIEAESSKINFAPKADTQDWKPVIKSAGKAGKDAAEEYKDALKDELSDLDDMLGFITDTIQDQIDLYGDQKDAAVDALTAQKDAAREVYEAQQKAIDAQIKAKEKQIDAIREQINANKDENEAIKLQINLEKAQFEAEQLRRNKTIRQYSDSQGIHYTTDSHAIREKEQEVDEKKDEIKIFEMEQSIAQIEKSITLLEEQKEAIDNMIEQSDTYFDNLIEQTEAYYNAMIESLNEYKSRWEQLSELEETAKMEAKLKELGITTEDLANMSEETFQRVKNAYIDTLREAYAGNDAILEQLNILDSTDMSGINSELGITTEKFGELENTNLSTLSGNMTDASNSASGLSEDISSISSSINDINTKNLSNATTQFTLLAEAIKGVATALGIDGDGTVSSLVTALNSLNEVNLGGMSEDGSGTGIIAQFNALKTAVDDVTSSISGGASTSNEGGGLATGDNGGSATPNMGGEGTDGLIGSIDKLQQTADENLGSGTSDEGEGTGIIGKFSALKTAIDDVTDAIGKTEDNSLDKGASNLISAIQLESKVVGDELPNQISLFSELLTKINECVTSLGNMATAIQGASGSLSGLSLGCGGQNVPQFLAKGTTNAKKGLTVVGEEAPELIEKKSGDLALVTQPTLLNMEGGEKVYNGDETEKLLKGNKIHDAWVEYTTKYANNPELLASSIEKKYPEFYQASQDIWARQLDYIMNKDKVATRVENRTQTQNLTQNINVTLPNVTNETGFRNFEREMQGFQLKALQQCHRR